jgi:unsaturated rhamnogalacturonyl hydrolase
VIRSAVVVSLGSLLAALPAARAQARAGDAPWSERFAGSVMKRNPEVTPRWDYVAGVVLLAIDRVAATRRDDAMRAYVRRNMDRFVQPDGTIRGYKLDEFNLDQIAQGRLLFPLYRRTQDNR